MVKKCTQKNVMLMQSCCFACSTPYFSFLIVIAIVTSFKMPKFMKSNIFSLILNLDMVSL